MFFQAMATFVLLLCGVFAIWKLVISPVLKAKGVDIDSSGDMVNKDTKKLEKIQKDNIHTP